jgi:hypothetical protein
MYYRGETTKQFAVPRGNIKYGHKGGKREENGRSWRGET